MVYVGNECGGKAALEQHQREQAKANLSENASGSLEFFRRALALQEADVDLSKRAVAERINAMTQQIVAASADQTTAIAADQLVASLIFTRASTVSPRAATFF
jgi:conserved oligomeric Golgi complex subunit 3